MDFIFDLARLESLAAAGADGYRNGFPYPHAVFDDFLRPEAADALLEAFPDPRVDIGWDRYAAQGFEMKIACADERILPESVCRVFHQLNSGPFIRFLEQLTGIEHLLPDPHLLGGGLHVVGNGGHLGVHADFNWHPAIRAHRRVNLLIYLNHDWRPEYDGDLELWTTDAARKAVAIAPVFNRAVIFNTRSDTFHGHPMPLKLPPDQFRRSIAMYYYTSERPAEEIREPHNTRYKGLHLD